MKEVRALEVKFSNEEPTYEVANEEGEVTKEGILAMYAHCNVVELDSEASQFVEGMVKAKKVWASLFYLALLVDPLIMASVILEQLLMLFPIDFILASKMNLNIHN